MKLHVLLSLCCIHDQVHQQSPVYLNVFNEYPKTLNFILDLGTEKDLQFLYSYIQRNTDGFSRTYIAQEGSNQFFGSIEIKSPSHAIQLIYIFIFP